MTMPSVTIGRTTFDNVDYDREADVLYLHVGDPASAVDFDETPEGHATRFGTDGQLVGLTLVNARWLIDRDGHLTVTVPQRIDVPESALRGAV